MLFRKSFIKLLFTAPGLGARRPPRPPDDEPLEEELLEDAVPAVDEEIFFVRNAEPPLPANLLPLLL